MDASPAPAAPPDVVDNRARAELDPRDGWKRFDYARWIEVYEEKGTVTAACKAVGISRETAYSRRRVDPDFAALWNEAEVAVTEVLETTLVEVALDPDNRGQVRALEIALKARRPDKYREQVKLEHGGTVTHEIEVKIDAESTELEERLGLIPTGEAPPAGDPPPRALASGN